MSRALGVVLVAAAGCAMASIGVSSAAPTVQRSA
jgi:hypothetical protein